MGRQNTRRHVPHVLLLGCQRGRRARLLQTRLRRETGKKTRKRSRPKTDKTRKIGYVGVVTQKSMLRKRHGSCYARAKNPRTTTICRKSTLLRKRQPSAPVMSSP